MYLHGLKNLEAKCRELVYEKKDLWFRNSNGFR